MCYKTVGGGGGQVKFYPTKRGVENAGKGGGGIHSFEVF